MRYIADVFMCLSAHGNTAIVTGTSNRCDYTFNSVLWQGKSQSIVVDLPKAELVYDSNVQTTHSVGLNMAYMDAHVAFVTTNLTKAPTSWLDGIEQ